MKPAATRGIVTRYDRFTCCGNGNKSRLANLAAHYYAEAYPYHVAALDPRQNTSGYNSYSSMAWAVMKWSTARSV
jgi:hypothetical protein